MAYDADDILFRTFGNPYLRIYNKYLTVDKPRPRARIKALIEQSEIKIPPFYDISHWKIVNDWYNITPRPLLMGTKATQSNNYKDPTFIDYFQKMKDIVKCRRLAYHFFEKTVDPVKQANWFVDYIEPYITNADLLCLDFEQGGETAPQLWAFLDRVSQRRPNNQLIIYSRKNLMDPISMTSSEKAFFKAIPSWPAGYPSSVDGITTTPAGYIPDQSKWGPVWAWQYTDSGHVGGIDGDTDCNLMEPPLIEFCGGISPEPPSDIVTTPYDGIDRIVGRRFNSDAYITIIDPAIVRIEVVHETPFDNGLFFTSDACQTRNASLGWNGDEWDKQAPLPAYPKNFAMSNGSVYVERKSAEPSLCIRTDGGAYISHQVTGGVRQASTGRRYLIENGTIKDYLSGSEPQYTERHPRGLAGVTADGKVIMVTVDGRTSKSVGVTLKEGAQILKEFGAHTAFDRGGGGDAVDVMNGIVQNVPCDTDSSGQPGVERAIPQSILVYAEEPNMSEYDFDATALGDGTRIRVTHDTSGKYVNSYPKGTVFSGDTLFTATQQLSNSNGVYQMVGDKWLQVIKVNGQPPLNQDTGQPMTNPVWVAVIHMGGTICTLVDNGAPVPEPPTGAVHVEMTIESTGYKPLTLSGDLEPE